MYTSAINTNTDYQIKLKITKYFSYTPHYMYKGFFFPTFLSGYTYIMSQDVAQNLLRAAFTTPIINLEDVYITGILANKIKIQQTKHHLFAFKKLGSMCGLKGIIAENGRDPYEFYTALKFVLTPNKTCGLLNETYVKYFYKIVYYTIGPLIAIWNNYKFWFPPVV